MHTTPWGSTMRTAGGWFLAAVLLSAFSAFGADKKTERQFASKCSSCHGKDGKAQTENGKKMKMRDLASDEIQKESDDAMKKSIADGVKTEKDGVKQEMDAFKDEIKGPDLDALVKYVREFKK